MKQQHKVPFGIMGIFMAIGIVYGDIGTSPLYVMKAIINGLPSGLKANPDYIIGAISCIIWTLTLQTTIKYVIVTLRADNKGEGGILSLFALMRKSIDGPTSLLSSVLRPYLPTGLLLRPLLWSRPSKGSTDYCHHYR